MPLVVPVLRFFLVFLNVYETFKTLKPPPPSARRGGQPSVRAMSQRKRDLKGCLAIWAVWCCYAAFERTFDRIVGIFLPFYGEIKSVLLLFLLLTRAKGAEPLFLHVLRPLVKPYAAVVDPILELSRDLGDFFFALMQAPLDFILSSPWFPFPSWRTGNSDEELSESVSNTQVSSIGSGKSARTNSNSSIPMLVKPGAAVQPSRVQNRRNGPIRSASDGQRSNNRPFGNNAAVSRSTSTRERHLKSASTASLPPYTEYSSRDPPRYSQTLPRRGGHQIWYPPASADESREEVSTSTPDLLVAPEYSTPEWRTYPAFPSAYPPTPLPTSASLPTPITITRSSSDSRRISESTYPPIDEDPTAEQGFDELLERQHVGNPGSDRSSSNNNEGHHGDNHQEYNLDGTHQPDDDTLIDGSIDSSEAELSDDFDATLRTPSRSSAAYSSDESLTGALSTADGASSLRTQTSSESVSSESSLAGQKRSRGVLQSKVHSSSQSRYATLRGRPILPPSHQDDLQSSSSENIESEISDDDNAGVKRQKTLVPPQRKTTLRPVARGAANTRQTPIPTRGSSVRGRASATSSQSTVRGRGGAAVTGNQSTVRGRKSTLGSHRSQGVTKTSSTSSQSGTLRGRAR